MRVNVIKYLFCKHRAVGGGCNQLSVSCKVSRNGLFNGFERGKPFSNFFVGKPDVKSAGVNVYVDYGTVLNYAYNAARRRFGANVPYRAPRVAPENLPSVINATLSPSPAPTMAEVGVSISRIPGPPKGPS